MFARRLCIIFALSPSVARDGGEMSGIDAGATGVDACETFVCTNGPCLAEPGTAGGCG